MWEALPQTWAAPASSQIRRGMAEGRLFTFVHLAFPLAADWFTLLLLIPSLVPGPSVVSSVPSSLTVQEPSRILVPHWDCQDSDFLVLICETTGLTNSL